MISIDQNSSLGQELTKVIQSVSETTGEAKNFIMGELPDVIQQLLIWYGIYGFIEFIIATIVIPLGMVFYWRWFVKAEPDLASGVDEFFGVGGVIISFIFTLTAFFLFNLQWLKIWIAPKIWLIEYASTILK